MVSVPLLYFVILYSLTVAAAIFYIKCGWN